MRILSFSVMVTLGTLASAQAQAQETQRRGGMEMTAPDMVVFFDLDRADLKAGTEENLNELANWLILGEDRSVVITADSATGTAASIAERRSAQVRDHLIRQGVSPNQITIVDMGDPVELTDNQRILVTTDRSPASVGATSNAEVYDTGRTTYERPMSATTPVAEEEPQARGGMDRLGLSVAAGGGVRGFSSQAVRNVTDPGAIWEARVGIGMNNWVGVEAAYIGSWHGLDGQFEAGGSSVDIYGNGVEGNLRVNLTQNFPVQPYVLAGVGWTHYTVREDGVAAGATLQDNDNVLETPVGAGIATRIGPALLDVRGTFRPAFEDDLFDEALGGNPDLHNWSAVARLGFNI